jgi:hypothetical protein
VRNRYLSVKIERGYPAPRARRTDLPFELLDVGDSFRAPLTKTVRSVVVAVYKANAGSVRRFAWDADGRWIRVWRIA